jgi:hypothetical protein
VAESSPSRSLRAQLVRFLADQEIAIAQALTRAAGGGAMCVVERSGRVSGGAKYEEGRFTALRECHRALDDDHDARSREALGDLLEAVRTRWTELLEHHQRQDPPGLTWLAYAQGGRDFCGEALNLLLKSPRRGG